MSGWESLYASPRLNVIETSNGVLVIVGNRERGQAVGEELGPEQIAHLAHALDKWVARFTNNA